MPFLKPSPDMAQSSARKEPGLSVTRLPNGLIVATSEMPHMTSVSLGLWLGVGSRCEPEELSGASHLIEHMLFKGTSRRSARKISEAVEGLGGYMNAFTSEESTCFYSKACHEHFRELLDVLMDMVLHSRFDPEDISKDREVIKEEMSMYLDEPQHRVQELLNATMWPNQPLGRPITGSDRSLDGITRPMLLGYLHRHYLAGSALLVAAGRITHSQVLRAAARYAPRFRAGDILPFAPATNGQDGPAISLFTKKTEQTQIALGFRGFSRHSPRRHAVRVLSTILGENMSSRLFQVVREDHGLAYSIYTAPSFFADTGDFVISAGLDTDKLPGTLKLIMAELQRIREKPPRLSELRRAIDYLVGQINLNLEGTENQMNWFGEQLLGYGRTFTAAHVKRQLASVTAGEIQAAARDLFRPERLNFALVSPLKVDRHLHNLVRL
jgi:predicted Zn-dependent peptidase